MGSSRTRTPHRAKCTFLRLNLRSNQPSKTLDANLVGTVRQSTRAARSSLTYESDAMGLFEFSEMLPFHHMDSHF